MRSGASELLCWRFSLETCRRKEQNISPSVRRRRWTVGGWREGRQTAKVRCQSRDFLLLHRPLDQPPPCPSLPTTPLPSCSSRASTLVWSTAAHSQPSTAAELPPHILHLCVLTTKCPSSLFLLMINRSVFAAWAWTQSSLELRLKVKHTFSKLELATAIDEGLHFYLRLAAQGCLYRMWWHRRTPE